MSAHPLHSINLALRFILELIGIYALGDVGHHVGHSLNSELLALVCMLLFPAMAMIIWGVFAVPNDPSRSAKAVIAVPGSVRLLIEVAFFSSAVIALMTLAFDLLATLYLLAVIIHHLFSRKRLSWLLKQRGVK